METFLISGYSFASVLTSLGALFATLNQRWQAAYISGWCFWSPSVMVTKLQMNMPAFQRYWPLLRYSSALSKCGFSTKRSALKNVVLVFFAPGGVGSSIPVWMY